MRLLATVARAVLDAVEVSEAQAYTLLLAHVRTCRGGCKPSAGHMCAAGLNLHAQWERAQRAQPASATR